ncbi:MAG: PsbP-related protein [Patescibacteria group bacterium]
MNKGITPIAIILIIIGVLAVGGGIYYYQTQTEPIISQSTPTPSSTPQDETANWQTYRNEKYGVEFKYPADYEIESEYIYGEPVITLFNSTPEAKNDYNLDKDGWIILDIFISRDLFSECYKILDQNFILGDKNTKRCYSPGMYGSEEIIWENPQNKFNVEFNIQNMENVFTKDAYTIIKTFKFID